MAGSDRDAADARLLSEALGVLEAALDAPAPSPDALAASLAVPVKAFGAAAKQAIGEPP
jgi:hypothetical protein